MDKMTRKKAIEQKFKIDSTCYPNVAYKGARFSPEEIFDIPTEKEEELTELCKFQTIHAGLITNLRQNTFLIRMDSVAGG